jgi:SNF2 family DNA or RNA helicase
MTEQTNQNLPVAVTTTATVLRYKRSYKVMFGKNAHLSESFKALDNRQFNKDDELWGWVVNKEGLYDVMMEWKHRGGVQWEFKPAELQEQFRQEALAIRDLKRQQQVLRQAITDRNAAAELYKQQLREDRDFKLGFYDQVTRPDTKISFYYHQHIATAWLIQRAGGILAAEMGLGKTFVFCLASLMLSKPGEKILIIAPKSLVLGIIADLERLLPQSWYFLGYGRKQATEPAQATFFFASYTYFSRASFDIEKYLTAYGIDKPAVVAMDESHMVKNHSSLTFKNINAAFGGRGIPMICSSGTPIKSSSREIWTQLHLIDPVSFPSRSSFEKEYCGAFMDPRWKRIVYDPTLERRQELNALLQPYMFRVRKDDVINLPPKIYRKLVIPLTPAERKNYESFRDQIREELLAEGSEAIAMTVLGKMRQYCAQQKIAYVQELVARHVEEGEKVVLVDQFKQTIYDLQRHYGPRAVVHTGDQDIDERRAAVNLFQQHPRAGDPAGVDVFLGTTDTCKYGLTLTAACILYLISLPWTPAECDQVYDRLHRISQTRTVLIFIPVLEGTVDEYIYDTVEVKRATLLEIIDNQGYAGNMKTSIFQDVMAYLLRK